MAARDPTAGENNIVAVARAIGNLGINAREVCMRALTHAFVHVYVHDACTCARVGACTYAFVHVLMHTFIHVRMHASRTYASTLSNFDCHMCRAYGKRQWSICWRPLPMTRTVLLSSKLRRMDSQWCVRGRGSHVSMIAQES